MPTFLVQQTGLRDNTMANYTIPEPSTPPARGIIPMWVVNRNQRSGARRRAEEMDHDGDNIGQLELDTPPAPKKHRINRSTNPGPRTRMDKGAHRTVKQRRPSKIDLTSQLPLMVPINPEQIAARDTLKYQMTETNAALRAQMGDLMPVFDEVKTEVEMIEETIRVQSTYEADTKLLEHFRATRHDSIVNWLKNIQLEGRPGPWDLTDDFENSRPRYEKPGAMYSVYQTRGALKRVNGTSNLRESHTQNEYGFPAIDFIEDTKRAQQAERDDWMTDWPGLERRRGAE